MLKRYKFKVLLYGAVSFILFYIGISRFYNGLLINFIIDMMFSAYFGVLAYDNFYL